MLTSLRRGGILHSIRGPRGGYQLQRPPAEIRVSEVVACLEGEPAARVVAGRQSPEFEVLDTLAAGLESRRLELLQSTTLQDLLDQRNSRLREQAMYFI
jgi:Rrf2 family protein